MNRDNKTIPDNTLYILCPLCYYYGYIDMSDIAPYDINIKCQCGYNKTLSVDDFTKQIYETNKKVKDEILILILCYIASVIDS